jgi:hypothetical protein
MKSSETVYSERISGENEIRKYVEPGPAGWLPGR